MAVRDAKYPTLLEIVNRTAPDGSEHELVNMLALENPILHDATPVEANDTRSHEVSVVLGLPDATWKRFYGGVQPSRGVTGVVTEKIAMLGAFGEVDADMADRQANKAAFLMSENELHIDAMANEVGRSLFYGDITSVTNSDDKYAFNGLAPRYDDLSAANAEMIVNAGGSGDDNTSIWVVNWAPNGVFTTYPKGGLTGGIKVTDHGRCILESAPGGGGRLPIYRTEYGWDIGFCLKNWKYVSRICNIDVSALATFGTSSDTAANLINCLIDAVNALKNTEGNVAIYCNKAVKSALDKMAAAKGNVMLSIDEWGGKPITAFQGIPIRKCESILNTEATVS